MKAPREKSWQVQKFEQIVRDDGYWIKDEIVKVLSNKITGLNVKTKIQKGDIDSQLIEEFCNSDGDSRGLSLAIANHFKSEINKNNKLLEKEIDEEVKIQAIKTLIALYLLYNDNLLIVEESKKSEGFQVVDKGFGFEKEVDILLANKSKSDVENEYEIVSDEDKNWQLEAFHKIAKEEKKYLKESIAQAAIDIQHSLAEKKVRTWFGWNKTTYDIEASSITDDVITRVINDDSRSEEDLRLKEKLNTGLARFYKHFSLLANDETRISLEDKKRLAKEISDLCLICGDNFSVQFETTGKKVGVKDIFNEMDKIINPEYQSLSSPSSPTREKNTPEEYASLSPERNANDLDNSDWKVAEFSSLVKSNEVKKRISPIFEKMQNILDEGDNKFISENIDAETLTNFLTQDLTPEKKQQLSDLLKREIIQSCRIIPSYNIESKKDDIFQTINALLLVLECVDGRNECKNIDEIISKRGGNEVTEAIQKAAQLIVNSANNDVPEVLERDYDSDDSLSSLEEDYDLLPTENIADMRDIAWSEKNGPRPINVTIFLGFVQYLAKQEDQIKIELPFDELEPNATIVSIEEQRKSFKAAISKLPLTDSQAMARHWIGYKTLLNEQKEEREKLEKFTNTLVARRDFIADSASDSEEGNTELETDSAGTNTPDEIIISLTKTKELNDDQKKLVENFDISTIYQSSFAALNGDEIQSSVSKLLPKKDQLEFNSNQVSDLTSFTHKVKLLLANDEDYDLDQGVSSIANKFGGAAKLKNKGLDSNQAKDHRDKILQDLKNIWKNSFNLAYENIGDSDIEKALSDQDISDAVIKLTAISLMHKDGEELFSLLLDDQKNSELFAFITELANKANKNLEEKFQDSRPLNEAGSKVEMHNKTRFEGLVMSSPNLVKYSYTKDEIAEFIEKDEIKDLRISVDIVDGVIVVNYHGASSDFAKADGSKIDAAKLRESELEVIMKIIKQHNVNHPWCRVNNYVIQGDWNDQVYNKKSGTKQTGFLKSASERLNKNHLTPEKIDVGDIIIKERMICNPGNQQGKKGGDKVQSSSTLAIAGKIENELSEIQDLDEEVYTNIRQPQILDYILGDTGGKDHAKTVLEYQGLTFISDGSVPTAGVKTSQKLGDIIDMSKFSGKKIEDIFPAYNKAQQQSMKKLYSLIVAKVGNEDQKEKYGSVDAKGFDFEESEEVGKNFRKFHEEINKILKTSEVDAAKIIDDWTDSAEFKAVSKYLTDNSKKSAASDNIKKVTKDYKSSKRYFVDLASKALNVQPNSGYEPVTNGIFDAGPEAIEEMQITAIAQDINSLKSGTKFYYGISECGIEGQKTKEFMPQLNQSFNSPSEVAEQPLISENLRKQLVEVGRASPTQSETSL